MRWTQHWIKVVIAAKHAKENNLHLHWDVDGAESLVCQEDGFPIQGMSCKRKNLKIYFSNKDSVNDLVLYIQVSCTGLIGAGNNGMINPPDDHKTYNLTDTYLFTRDEEKYEVFMDLSVIYDIAKNTDADASLSYDALYTGNSIINIITQSSHSTESYKEARRLSQTFFNSNKVNLSRDCIHAIGNCHIDCAWLWPYKETIRKVARSWSSTISMMKDGLDFNFAGSQVVQFNWLKTHYPSLFDALKVMVKEQRFIPVGGSWVEMDTNIPSGESMIRQFLYGQKFYREEFGMHSDILWLPDTFGYSGQLPQIMKLCDIKYFLSQKLSWNLTNTFPHHTFFWKGIDQSKVLAHFPPGDTYESHIDVKDVLKTVTNNKDKGRTHDQMLLFGYGDGGGGPTPDMIERLNRLSSVEGFPKIVVSTPNKFFEAVQESSDMLCEWWGELYFELHRGTYTSHAKLKEYNRRFEFMMMDIEFLFTTNFKKQNSISSFEELWKIVLFNQFHDILPGSSIEKVFIDAMADCKKFLDLYAIEWNNCLESGMIFDNNYQNIVINPYNWPRKQIVELHNKNKILVEVPGIYIGPVILAETKDTTNVVETADNVCLSNCTISATFSRKGCLKSLINKQTNRECLKKGVSGNMFVIFDDIPLFWDAWDVMEYHTETRQEYLPTHLEIIERGPMSVSVMITVPLGEHGDIKVVAMVQADCPYLCFKAEVAWQASHKFLKVEFPLAVSATQATYEIQCGHVSRPTHNNTSWDVAQFEVSGHKWAHLGEPNFGVGLLSKSKYGYSSQHSQLTLSLLRSSKAPDANADMGNHTIEYAVYPHSGPLESSRIVQHAFNFNHPLKMVKESPDLLASRVSNFTSLTVEGENVVVQAIKQSEDGKGLVVRMYEAYGNTVSTCLSYVDVSAAFSINAVERCSSKTRLPVSGNMIGPLEFTPFQIRSVYIESRRLQL